MKYTLLIALAVVVGIGAVGSYLNKPLNVSGVQDGVVSATSTTMEVVPEEEIDVVESAKVELERINQELDAEETRLVEERKRIQAEKDAELKEIDARLDEINQTRVSFQ